MTSAIPSLKPTPKGEVSTTPGRGNHIYWRLESDWIAHGEAHAAAWNQRMRRGHSPLQQYGQFPYSRNTVDADGEKWDARAQPWRMFFQKGGAKEFCVDQIFAHNWHLHPPYREVTFPQLEGIYWEAYDCPECERGVFTSREKGFAPADLVTHLRMGHEWTRAEVAEYAREMDFTFKRKRRTHLPQELQEKLTQTSEETVPEAERDEEYKCKVCGWRPSKKNQKKGMSLKAHTRLRHKVAPSGGALKE